MKVVVIFLPLKTVVEHAQRHIYIQCSSFYASYGVRKPLCQSKFLYNVTSYARGEGEGSVCVYVL